MMIEIRTDQAPSSLSRRTQPSLRTLQHQPQSGLPNVFGRSSSMENESGENLREG